MSLRVPKDKRIALLKSVDLLSACNKNELRQIATQVTELDVPAGKILAEQGMPGREFFIIVEGRATASRNGVFLAELHPADFFGELALLDGGARTATVVAETDIHLIVLSRGEFKHVCTSFPSVAPRMLAEIGARLRKADEALGGDRVSRSLDRLTL